MSPPLDDTNSFHIWNNWERNHLTKNIPKVVYPRSIWKPSYHRSACFYYYVICFVFDSTTGLVTNDFFIHQRSSILHVNDNFYTLNWGVCILCIIDLKKLVNKTNMILKFYFPSQHFWFFRCIWSLSVILNKKSKICKAELFLVSDE